MNKIIDGKRMSLDIEDEIKSFAKGCIIRPSVAVINIGNDPVSERYIKAKEDACNRTGIYFRYHQYDEDTPELTIINKIKELNNDDYVNGIMINLPIPEKYNEKRLLNTIINSKDIDGLTDINIGRLISGRKTIIPCCALAIMEILKAHDIDVDGKHVVLVGKGKLVSRPLMHLLLNEGATVTICHTQTTNLKKHILTGDIVISSTGMRNLITADMIKEEAVVIDAGCSFEDGKLYGDVDFDKVAKKALLITPSKGGVGPMTVAMFLKNIILCYNNKK